MRRHWIRNDPNEHVNLAQTMPDVLKMMQEKLKMEQASRFQPDQGDHARIKFCDIGLNKYGGFWGPIMP